MDELEFRRRITAQPNEVDKALLDFAQKSVDKQHFLDEMQALDKHIENALNIPVPDTLAERIILNTSLKEKTQPHQNTNRTVNFVTRFKLDRMHLALAASVIVTIGVFTLTTQQNTLQNAGNHALAHVYSEIKTLHTKGAINLQEVNNKLALLGAQIIELPGKVTYVNFCDFQGEKGIHLVFESDFGPMTVFIVPTKNKVFDLGKNDFKDSRFAGNIFRGKKADTVLIANLGSPVTLYNERVTGALRWL